jgi:hypothetical protein
MIVQPNEARFDVFTSMIFVHVGPRGAKHFRIVHLTNETPVKMDTIIAERDVVATDIVAAR